MDLKVDLVTEFAGKMGEEVERGQWDISGAGTPRAGSHIVRVRREDRWP